VVEINEAFNDQRSVAIALNGLAGVLQEQGKLDEAAATFQRVVEINEALNDQRSVAIALNGLAGVLQQQGKLDEAAATFQRRVEIREAFNDQRKESWNEAEEVLRCSQDIFEELHDFRNIAMVLNSLGGLLRKQGKWEAAEAMLRCGYNLAAEKLKDKRGQAIILNSLGQVLSQQQDAENFKLAIMYFRASITLGQELDDQPHLAKVYTAMGQALLSNRETEQAVIQLIQGFEIDESLTNRFGLGKVTPQLTHALVRLGKRDEALAYCQRALAIDPTNRKLQELCDRLSSPNPIKKGTVKHIRYNT
jgi:tetratricopeptide (TPR) repeat protein